MVKADLKVNTAVPLGAGLGVGSGVNHKVTKNTEVAQRNSHYSSYSGPSVMLGSLKKSVKVCDIFGLEPEEGFAKSGRFNTVAEGLNAVDGDYWDVESVSLQEI